MLRRFVLALVLVALAGRPVAAQPLYDFTWQSFAAYQRSTPDGASIGPSTGSLDGHGVLSLAPRSDGGYDFQFSGTGGSGAGAALPGVLAPLEITDGQFTFPVPPGVIVFDGFLTSPASGVPGTLSFTGAPASPETIEIRFSEVGHSNTFGANWELDFVGTGLRSAQSTVQAGEPSDAAAVIVAGSLATALGLRRRRAVRVDASPH